MFFFEPGEGENISFVGPDEFDHPDCGSCGACDPINGLRFAERTGFTDEPGASYVGRTVCRGLRPTTEGERGFLTTIGRPDILQICDIEMRVVLDE